MTTFENCTGGTGKTLVKIGVFNRVHNDFNAIWKPMAAQNSRKNTFKKID